jgi:hypothetical protein
MNASDWSLPDWQVSADVSRSEASTPLEWLVPEGG